MKVLIVGGSRQYARMFENYGWEVVEEVDEANLVQFCGGADVSPHLYGEADHPRTFSNPAQDEFEQAIFDGCRFDGKPMAGICRGGQFLNVMNGGKMYQDVDHHAVGGTHEAVDVLTSRKVQVSSTHHQMMRPSEDGEVLAVAHRSQKKEYMNEKHELVTVIHDNTPDTEVVLYEDSKCLCFQPHPEFSVGDPAVKGCADYYFELLDNLVKL